MHALLDDFNTVKEKSRASVALWGSPRELQVPKFVFPAFPADTRRVQAVRTVRSAAVAKLGLIQQELFDIGGECSFMPGQVPEMVTVISQEQADRLCDEMDVWTEQLEPLSSFILPAGSPLISTIHLARTIARRAERMAVQIRDSDGDDAVRDVVIAYLNRLSDWFFVLARWVGMVLGESETLWVPLGKRMLD